MRHGRLGQVLWMLLWIFLGAACGGWSATAAGPMAGKAAVLVADGLRLEFDPAGSLRTLGVGSTAFQGKQAATGLRVRSGVHEAWQPAAVGSDAPAETTLAGAGLTVSAGCVACGDHLELRGAVVDTRRQEDRAVDVALRLPFGPATWWESISRAVPPDAPLAETPIRRPAETLPEGAGVLERIEHGGLAQDYMPVACVTTPDGRAGVAVALPPDTPCRFRFAYVREAGCLELRFLFGLSMAAPPPLAGRAPFRCLVYAVDGRWGLRDALRRYQALYPAVFQRRTQASGLWLVSMPPLAKVTDPQHYAFWQATRLQETPQAIRLGLEAYPYTIVGQRELGYLQQPITGYDQVLTVLQTKPAATRHSRYTWEQVKPVVETCGLRDAGGKIIYRVRQTDWAGNSLSFPVNPSPFLPADDAHPTVASQTFGEVEAALRAHSDLAGFYVDSLAMWGSYENYRRDHFAAVRAPLTHDAAGRVYLPNWMPHVDYLRELRRRIAPRLVFANGARPGRAFCSLLLDVVGMEPSLADLQSRTQIDFLRSMAGPKPAVCLLDYPDAGLSRAQAEEYVQRFVALGLAPEMRRVPWPRYKERDADLYARFMPVQRRLDRAGWQPVTLATASAAGVWIERFGTRPPELYFSVYNPGTQAAETAVQIERAALGMGKEVGLREIVEDRPLADPARPIALAPHTLRVLQATR